MKSIESYNNICVSLDIAKNHLERFENEKKRLLSILNSRAPKDMKAQSYDDMPKGCMDATSMPRLLDMIHEVESHIELQKANIEFYSGLKTDTEEALANLDGLSYKVFYLNRIKGMSLYRVSEELDKSIRHIERISADITKNIFSNDGEMSVKP